MNTFRIEESQIKTEALMRLIDINGNDLPMLTFLDAIQVLWIAHQFKNEVLHDVKSIHLPIDPEGSLTEKMRVLQGRIQSIYLRIEGAMISRWMFKKAHDIFGMAIVQITEHDADCDIANGDVSPVFDNIDDLMAHLNQ